LVAPSSPHNVKREEKGWEGKEKGGKRGREPPPPLGIPEMGKKSASSSSSWDCTARPPFDTAPTRLHHHPITIDTPGKTPWPIPFALSTATVNLGTASPSPHRSRSRGSPDTCTLPAHTHAPLRTTPWTASRTEQQGTRRNNVTRSAPAMARARHGEVPF
jgi:hypothetical protein